MAKADPPTVVAVEWLPSFVNTRIIEGLQAELGVDDVQRFCAYGQDAELETFADALTNTPPDVLMTFGDHVSRELRKAFPAIPMLAMVIRDAETLQSLEAECPLAIISADPDAEKVADLARQLDNDAKTLAVIHTVDFAPNLKLVEALKNVDGLSVVPIHIAPGFCRTDSDFDLAIRNRYKEAPFDLLYVPDDPNCSRFGTQIFRTSTDIGVPAIGTSSTIGKGCVAGFVWDFEKAAKQAAGACTGLLEGKAPSKVLAAPLRIQVEDKALAAFEME